MSVPFRRQLAVALFRGLIGHKPVSKRGYGVPLGLLDCPDGWLEKEPAGWSRMLQASGCAAEDKAQSLVHWQYLMGAFSLSEGGRCPNAELRVGPSVAAIT